MTADLESTMVFDRRISRCMNGHTRVDGPVPRDVEDDDRRSRDLALDVSLHGNPRAVERASRKKRKKKRTPRRTRVT